MKLPVSARSGAIQGEHPISGSMATARRKLSEPLLISWKPGNYKKGKKRKKGEVRVDEKD